MTVEEPRATPDKITGMYLLFLMLLSLFMLIIFMMCLGMFLLNDMPALVLFDSGATQSFVSHAFNKNFDVTH